MARDDGNGRGTGDSVYNGYGLGNCKKTKIYTVRTILYMWWNFIFDWNAIFVIIKIAGT